MQGDAKDLGAKQKRPTSHHYRLFKYLHKCKREITSQRDQEDKALENSIPEQNELLPIECEESHTQQKTPEQQTQASKEDTQKYP